MGTSRHLVNNQGKTLVNRITVRSFLIIVVLWLVASTSSELLDEDAGKDNSEDLKRVFNLSILFDSCCQSRGESRIYLNDTHGHSCANNQSCIVLNRFLEDYFASLLVFFFDHIFAAEFFSVFFIVFV